MSDDRLRVGILGASGYTGAELLRLLPSHARLRVTLLTADRNAGQEIGAVFPQLAGRDLPTLVSVKEADWDQVDVVFCCLPHGTTQEIIAALPPRLRIVDLSADFRLHDIDVYAQWYGHEHRAPALQREAVYGLTEHARPALGNARLVASPGCYPTCAQLPLIPLLQARQIDPDDIVIDAKSGVSGAGRSAKEANLFTEVTEGVHAYNIASHRHAPEIEQGLSLAAGRPISVSFTPHLMPMSRGMLCTTYVRLENGASADDLRATLERAYAGEPFVQVVPAGVSPATRHVRGSNHCLIGVFADRLKNRAIVLSVLDNLTKGASGQALQNMNVMLGLPETMGLEQQPMFP
jgi:N-acetyl-gamma-glutamyl-phosphate reductase